MTMLISKGYKASGVKTIEDELSTVDDQSLVSFSIFSAGSEKIQQSVITMFLQSRGPYDTCHARKIGSYGNS